MRYSWTFEEVDAKLKNIMINIYRNASRAAADYDDPDNLMMGANIAGFEKVATAMFEQGIAY
jgi:glutamate dehydrogenase (NADP+)